MLRSRKADEDAYVRAVARWLNYLEGGGLVPGGGSLEALREYLDAKLSTGELSPDDIVAMALYSKLIEDYSCYTHLFTLSNTEGVFAAIADRLESLEGAEVRTRVMEAVEVPPVGARLENNPQAVRSLIVAIKTEMPLHRCRGVLTGNFHRIPLESFQAKKARFEAASSIDAYLEEERRLLLLELQRCLRDGLPWFELIVSDELIEMMQADETMGVGKRQGDRIIHTKVPFDALSFSREEDPALRSFHACHCPLVRTSIRDGEPVDALFCQCSAGFERLPFEAIFGEEVEVEVLETALSGAERCRFAIIVPERFR